MNKQNIYENMALLEEATKDMKLSKEETHTLGYLSQDDPQTIKNLCSIIEKAKNYYSPDDNTHGITCLVRKRSEGWIDTHITTQGDIQEIEVCLNNISMTLVERHYPIESLLEAVLDGILAAVSDDSDVSDIVTSLKEDLKS